MKPVAVLVLTVALSSWPAGAYAHEGSAPGATPVVVELFTSEGCSSCPPADDLLRRLSADQPVPGGHVIALGEHVDYWNDLGWDDRFASPQFSQRQRWYALERFGRGRIYTPQMVVDGAFEFVGSRGHEARAAIEQAARAPKLAVTLEVARPSPAAEVQLDLTVAPLPPGNRDGADIWLAVTQDDLQTRVRAGENGGALLEHAAVVRRLERVGRLTPAADRGLSRRLTLSLPEAWWAHPLHLVVFVQDVADQRVLGAAEAPVPASVATAQASPLH